MATSLAEQLKRLAAPQTSLLNQDKKRASLLFDPKEAATLTREQLYQIGLDGLEGLKNKNPVFKQFENTLFHYTAKDFERAVQPVEANEKVNKNISKFLLLLSPYFMLYDSYKTLEWLIHRYHIHEYNKEDILLLILPYHETNIFVRMLQLLNLNESNDKWYWLHSLQKPGIHLPKETLYNHAATDPFFLKILSKYMTKIVKEHQNPTFLTVIYNFYCSTITGAIEFSKEVNETQVTQMLPSILKGLKSETPDFCASAYVITARLVAKTDLSANILLKLIEKITLFPVMILRSEALTLLIIIYQTQKDFNEFSEAILDNIASTDWLTKLLQKFDDDGMHLLPFVDPLIKEYLKKIMENEEKAQYRTFVQQLLNDLHFNDDFVSSLISAVLDVYHRKTKYHEDIESFLKNYMDIIERHYPSAFDTTINTIMKPTHGDNLNKTQKSIQKLLQTKIDETSRFSLYEKLYSPISTTRKEAIKHLCQNFNTLKEREKDILKTVIYDRLNDENYQTVNETFKACWKKVELVIGEQATLEVCIKLLGKAQKFKELWWKISYLAIKVIARVAKGTESKIFLAVLPFLLPIAEDELKAANMIVELNYGENCPYLKSNLSILKAAPNHYKFFTTVFDSLSLNENVPDIKDLLNALSSYPEENRDVLHKYISTLLLSSTLPENCSTDIASGIIDILLTYLETSKLSLVKKESSVSNFILMARNNKFPLDGFLGCLETLFLKTQVPNKPFGQLDFFIDNELSKFYLVLLNILVKGSCSDNEAVAEKYAKSLENFFNRFANGLQLKIDAYFNVINSQSKYVDSEFQLSCVQNVNKLLCEELEDLTSCVAFKSLTVPYILVTLGNPDRKIREAAFLTLDTLSNYGNRTSDNYMSLIQYILKFKEEIVLDHTQVPIVIKNILTNDFGSYNDTENNDKSNKKLKNALKHMVNLLPQENIPLCLIVGLNQLLGLVNDPDMVTITVKYPIKILTTTEAKELDIQSSLIIYYNITKFNEKLATEIKINQGSQHSEIWTFILTCLKKEKFYLVYNDLKTSPSVLMLQQITRDFFACLQEDVRKALLDSVVTAASETKDPQLISAAGYIFKKIDLDCNLVIDQLTKMRDIQSPKVTETKKKRRVSVIPTIEILDTSDWKKGMTILELIQDKKKLRNTDLIVPILFEILKKCLDFDEQDNVEYVKQLILSTLLHCCEKTEDDHIPDTSFNMELVVKCITASKNPQTHHHALVVLAQAAKIVPQQVLHHIMANFTFIGSPVLRHDDAYSFQIITRIIDTIVPLLIETGNEASICKLLRVFVDAILDVPIHRRNSLYKLLLEKIGVANNLHLFLTLVFEAHVMQVNNEKQKTATSAIAGIECGPNRLEIAADLCREFTPDLVIIALIKLIKYLKELPEEKSHAIEVDGSHLFDIEAHTPKQFRHFKYAIVQFIGNLLSSKAFVHQIADLSDEELLKLEPLCKDVIINILTYIQAIAKLAEKDTNPTQAQYWKVILHHSYDILDSLNALLTPQMFLLVVRGLMEHTLATVRRRAMELLNSKLLHNQTFFEKCEESELMVLLPPILRILKTIEREVPQEEEIIVQTGLLSLKLLVKKLASNNPDKFVQILDFIADLVKASNIKGNIMASLILCLAELCNNLRAHSISSLNKFMPAILKVLKSHQKHESSDLLLLSIITAIQKILDNLALFLSPYLEKLLINIANLCSCYIVEENIQQLGSFGTKLLNVKQKLGTLIPTRLLVPAIENSYETLSNKHGFKSIGPLMDILSENLKNLKPIEIKDNLPLLTSFLLNVLQFRVDKSPSVEEANLVEDHINKALLTLILKLSDVSFRPLYNKLYEWVRGDVKSERVITFYSLSKGIANTLKSLFTLFTVALINNAASLLDNLNSAKTEGLYFDEEPKNIILLNNILETLSAIFLYDNQRYINKTRFNILMQPIVDQIENILGGETTFLERSKNILIPCIVNFEQAVCDDSLWKSMNYQILLKMRHNSPNVRLVALDCLTAIVKKMGEEFLPFLPESIPFLSELLEDENEGVEQAARKSIQEMEKVLGENLEKYF